MYSFLNCCPVVCRQTGGTEIGMIPITIPRAVVCKYLIPSLNVYTRQSTCTCLAYVLVFIYGIVCYALLLFALVVVSLSTIDPDGRVCKSFPERRLDRNTNWARHTQSFYIRGSQFTGNCRLDGPLFTSVMSQ